MHHYPAGFSVQRKRGHDGVDHPHPSICLRLTPNPGTQTRTDRMAGDRASRRRDLSRLRTGRRTALHEQRHRDRPYDIHAPRLVCRSTRARPIRKACVSSTRSGRLGSGSADYDEATARIVASGPLSSPQRSRRTAARPRCCSIPPDRHCRPIEGRYEKPRPSPP